MNALFDAANEVASFMSERRWRYCIIGGLAVARWGEPRTTLDVGIRLLTGWGGEEPFVTALLNRFESRLPDARDFALERRILLLRASNGRDIDIALGALPFEEEMIGRAVSLEFAPGLRLPCCTAEDLFIMKAFAGRPRDWLDAESIRDRQQTLDVHYVVSRLGELAELRETPETMTKARNVLEGHS